MPTTRSTARAYGAPAALLLAAALLAGCTARAPETAGPSSTPSLSGSSDAHEVPPGTASSPSPRATGSASPAPSASPVPSPSAPSPRPWPTPAPSPSAPPLPRFPVGVRADYQLGGPYPVPRGVGLVARDVTERPAQGVFSVCYVNAFQTQPGDERWREHPRAILRDPEGRPVVDPSWPDEMILDTSSAASRREVLAVVGEDVATCARKGFQAVELDNLDSFTRAEGLTRRGNAALARALTEQAHSLGLLVAQKNAAEHSRWMRREVGFDFAVAEECLAWDECRAYTSVYGDAVVDVEYDGDPRELCADTRRPVTTVLRDRGLSPRGTKGYVFHACPVR